MLNLLTVVSGNCAIDHTVIFSEVKDLLEQFQEIILRVQRGDPQGLKPALLAGLYGTAEAVPYPKDL